MKEKITSIISNPKVLTGMTMAATTIGTIGLMATPVFAAGTASTLITKLIGIICTIFFYIGLLLLVWGIAQLVLAFKNEDADSKSRAMMMIVVSIVLMGIDGLINALGIGDIGTVKRDTTI